VAANLVGGGPPRSGQGLYGGAAGTVSLGAGRMLCCGPLGALCAVGCGVGVDEGGGPLGEVDVGEQRQQVADGAVGFAQDVVADSGEVGEQLGEVAGGPPGGGGSRQRPSPAVGPEPSGAHPGQSGSVRHASIRAVPGALMPPGAPLGAAGVVGEAGLDENLLQVERRLVARCWRA
jgi:hypothetical protein